MTRCTEFHAPGTSCTHMNTCTFACGYAIHWQNSGWQRDLMNRAHHGPTLSLFIKRPSKDYIGATEIFKIFKYTRVCVQFVRWKENLTTALKLRSWTYARYSVGWTFVRSLVSLNVDKTSTNREHILWEEYKCWTALWSLCIVNRFNNWRELFLKGDR